MLAGKYRLHGVEVVINDMFTITDASPEAERVLVERECAMRTKDGRLIPTNGFYRDRPKRVK